MKFQKGHKKLGGRKQGARNKKTQQWEQFSNWFTSEGMEKLTLEIGKLEGKEFIYVMKDLLEYFKPKLSRIKEEINFDGKSIIQIVDYSGAADIPPPPITSF